MKATTDIGSEIKSSQQRWIRQLLKYLINFLNVVNNQFNLLYVIKPIKLLNILGLYMENVLGRIISMLCYSIAPDFGQLFLLM